MATTTTLPTAETAAALSDKDLVAAYAKDAARERVGVDYFLAKEMERRGFRSARTCDLTPAGRKIREATA